MIHVEIAKRVGGDLAEEICRMTAAAINKGLGGDDPVGLDEAFGALTAAARGAIGEAFGKGMSQVTLAKRLLIVGGGDAVPDAGERMAKRIGEIRKADTSIASDAAAIAKIASSRDDAGLWRDYRKSLDDVVQFRPVNPGPSTEPPIDATVTRQPPTKPRVARPPSGLSAGGEVFYDLADQEKARDPSLSDGAAIQAAMNTPAGKIAYRQYRAEHLVGLHKNVTLETEDRAVPKPSNGRTKYLDGFDAMVAQHMREHPGTSEAVARRRVTASGKGGTLLLQHERELRRAPDHVTS